jgi:hypothetical protein
MSVRGQYIKWREKRGQDMSNTIYSGIVVDNLNGQSLVVTQLSHGLRVLPFKDREVGLEGAGQTITLPDDFVAHVLAAYYADQAFQLQSAQFRQLCSDEQ